jgi:hypothetical protein
MATYSRREFLHEAGIGAVSLIVPGSLCAARSRPAPEAETRPDFIVMIAAPTHTNS